MGAVLPNYSTVWAGEGLHVLFSFHLNFKFQGAVKSTVVKKKGSIYSCTLKFMEPQEGVGGAKYFRRGPYISVHYRKVSSRGSIYF